jgi:hypothetical protein
MSGYGSVTHWIAALKEGNPLAAQPLWERYHAHLVGLVRQRLQASPRRSADEEDVVQDAFQRFFKGVQRGRFARLDDLDDLRRVLVCITFSGSNQRVADETDSWLLLAAVAAAKGWASFRCRRSYARFDPALQPTSRFSPPPPGGRITSRVRGVS